MRNTEFPYVWTMRSISGDAAAVAAGSEFTADSPPLPAVLDGLICEKCFKFVSDFLTSALKSYKILTETILHACFFCLPPAFTNGEQGEFLIIIPNQLKKSNKIRRFAAAFAVGLASREKLDYNHI